MSQPANPRQQPEADTAVRNRSQYATTLHRQDPENDETRPACCEADTRDDAEWSDVSIVAYRPHYGLCDNPACFGGSR